MVIIPTEKRFDWKHTPLVLFGIVILNVLIFFLYQSGDNNKLQGAINTYLQNDYFSHEWPLFQDYLSANEETDLLAQCQQMHDQGLTDQLSATIVMRTDFFKHIQELKGQGELAAYTDELMDGRVSINDEMQSTSFNRYGITPNDLKAHSLLSHQFLHGGIMHLLGNMFFLVVCGFAVEAALGHLRFLIFYLVAGLAGGLLHAFMEPQSGLPLVGASGAISGVMAMYLGVFRFRKIEFFYWFFVFVGYIRLPALLILPFYIGKEVYAYNSDTASNVAFMAHTGGFIAGAALLIISALLKPDILNQEYIEENQDIDPRQEELARVYSALEKFQFASAYRALEEFLTKYESDFDLLLLKYRLSKLLEEKAHKKNTLALLTLDTAEEKEVRAIEEIWKESDKNLLDDEGNIQLGMRFSALDNLLSAERIFHHLYKNKCQHPALGPFARRLSLLFEKEQNQKKKISYEKIAEALMLRNA